MYDLNKLLIKVNIIMTYSSGFKIRKGGEYNYNYDSNINIFFSKFMIFVILFMISYIPLYFMQNQHAHLTRLDQFNDLKNMDIKHLTNKSPIGSYVTAVSDGPIKTKVIDDYTLINVDGAVSLESFTEYCQWSEHSFKKCVSRSSDRKTCIQHKKVYYYTKIWLPYQVNSLLFNKPLLYHNPSRKNIPSKNVVSNSATFNVLNSNIKVNLNADQLQNVRINKERVVWSKIKLYNSWFFKPEPIHYETIEKLNEFKNSNAVTQEKFTYLSNNGYFYSPSKLSNFMSTLINALWIIDGFQLGDIMTSCTAGDIRMSYYGKFPKVITVIGEKTSQIENIVNIKKLDLFKNDTTVSTVYGEIISVTEIINSEVYISQVGTIFGIICIIIWCIILSRICFITLNGIDVTESIICWSLHSIILYIIMHGIIWFKTYTYNQVNFLIIIMGILYYIIIKNKPTQKVVTGFNSVWCMLSDWVGLPYEYIYVNKKYR